MNGKTSLATQYARLYSEPSTAPLDLRRYAFVYQTKLLVAMTAVGWVPFNHFSPKVLDLSLHRIRNVGRCLSFALYGLLVSILFYPINCCFKWSKNKRKHIETCRLSAVMIGPSIVIGKAARRKPRTYLWPVMERNSHDCARRITSILRYYYNRYQRPSCMLLGSCNTYSNACCCAYVVHLWGEKNDRNG